jgi:hypothetical protein
MTPDAKPKTLVVLQPGYLPWLGYFDQLRRADVFVVYDDVQFDKHGWRNRNRIKTPGGPLWLTVPVRHHGQGQPKNHEILIDGRHWQRKHIASLSQYYARAPHASRYLPELTDLLNRGWTHLIDLDMAVAGRMAEWFGLPAPALRSSTLGISGEQSQRLIDMCRHFGCTRYLSGDAASDYLDVALFASQGVEVQWQNYQHPVYPQLHGPFVPRLSAIDLLLNCGDHSAGILNADTADQRR